MSARSERSRPTETIRRPRTKRCRENGHCERAWRSPGWRERREKFRGPAERTSRTEEGFVSRAETRRRAACSGARRITGPPHLGRPETKSPPRRRPHGISRRTRTRVRRAGPVVEREQVQGHAARSDTRAPMRRGRRPRAGRARAHRIVPLAPGRHGDTSHGRTPGTGEDAAGKKEASRKREAGGRRAGAATWRQPETQREQPDAKGTGRGSASLRRLRRRARPSSKTPRGGDEAQLRLRTRYHGAPCASGVEETSAQAGENARCRKSEKRRQGPPFAWRRGKTPAISGPPSLGGALSGRASGLTGPNRPSATPADPAERRAGCTRTAGRDTTRTLGNAAAVARYHDGHRSEAGGLRGPGRRLRARV